MSTRIVDRYALGSNPYGLSSSLESTIILVIRLIVNPVDRVHPSSLYLES